MKKIVAVIAVAALLVLCFCLGMGLGSKDSAETIPGVYDDIMTMEQLDIDKACTMLSESSTLDARGEKLLAELSAMQEYQGTYLQLDEDGVSFDGYSGVLSFYLDKGELMCNLDYSNYFGTIDPAPIQPSDDENYSYYVESEGRITPSSSNVEHFRIHFNAEKLHVSWADDLCVYTLVRSDAEINPLEGKLPFEQSTSYTEMIEELESFIGSSTDYNYSYDGDSRTLDIYYRLKTDTDIQLAIIRIPEKTKPVMQDLLDLSSLVSDYMRDLIEIYYEFLPGHCNMYAVTELNEDNKYWDDEILLHVADGELVSSYKDILGK